uniref:Uncharacterized protein n=1 Tax=Pinctada fucata TaxID=50426 RepID=A0A194AMX2_PINFU
MTANVHTVPLLLITFAILGNVIVMGYMNAMLIQNVAVPKACSPNVTSHIVTVASLVAMQTRTVHVKLPIEHFVHLLGYAIVFHISPHRSKQWGMKSMIFIEMIFRLFLKK